MTCRNSEEKSRISFGFNFANFVQKTLAKALFTKTFSEKGDKEKCKFVVLKQDAVGIFSATKN